MIAKNRFQIKSFTNPSGVQVHRVEGRLSNGERVRQNFKTEREAQVHKAELEIKSLNLSVAMGLKPTRLTDTQLGEAEAAYRKLGDKSLAAAVEFYLNNYIEPVSDKTIQEAYDEFMLAKGTQNRRQATISDLKCRVGLLVQHYGGKLVSQVSSDDLSRVIFQPGIESQTQKHRRTKIGQFFNWSVKKQYCLRNPIDSVEIPVVEDSEPQVYDLCEVRALLKAAKAYKAGKLLPYFCLALFAGLRPAELKRVPWSSIKLPERIIRIEGKTAKRRKRRIVEISDNLVAWLLPYVGKPIVVTNWAKDFNAVRRMAGFKGSTFSVGDEGRKAWIADGLRHTSLTNHLALHESEGRTARWGGIHRIPVLSSGVKTKATF
ncbi:MAG: hypothetical protein JWQ71_3555 [Pedosphaera sp.]|nr:hypothetical protein [Pedosphaera sp.]